MKTTAFSAALFALALACEAQQTAPAPPSGVTVAPAILPGNYFAPPSIANHQMHCRGNHGDYTYTFFADGRYRFIARSQNRTIADSSEGRWTWKLLTTDRGELTLSNGQRAVLDFSAPLQATGRFDGDVRTFSFLFTREDGE